ncbi:MAG: choice-of-anchor I family protein, partial [Pseudomonadota bacterium]
AEIVSYDAPNARAFVAGGPTVDVLDATDGSLVGSLAFTNLPAGFTPDGVTGVAAKGGLGVVGLPADDQDEGYVAFFDTTTLQVTDYVRVGSLPDMVTFTPDGARVLVANEGEPNDDYDIDPKGSISVIDVATRGVTTIGFEGLNGLQTADPNNGERSLDGTRIFGPGPFGGTVATVAQDLEPEFIAVSPDGSQAMVTLQENNAVAILDLASESLVAVKSLGFKDHGQPGNEIDASNRDGIDGNFQLYPGLVGMYQPDGIAAFEVDGKTYYVTANEGDARDYDGFSEEQRVKDLPLAADFVAANGSDVQEDERLGRLNVTTTRGRDADGDFAALSVFGARSFSILDDQGNQVFESGNWLEELVLQHFPDFYNDGRSDNKGVEPESVEIGVIDDRTVAFVALERTTTGLTLAFDVNDPLNPAYLGAISFAGDVAPEGLEFVPGILSFDGNPLLLIANEVSGTTTAYELQVVPLPAAWLGFAAGIGGLAWLRRRQSARVAAGTAPKA